MTHNLATSFEAYLAMSFEAYRQDIQTAEAARQRAIVAELAHHCGALDDIEAAYRHDVVVARRRYNQRIADQHATQTAAQIPARACRGGVAPAG